VKTTLFSKKVEGVALSCVLPMQEALLKENSPIQYGQNGDLLDEHAWSPARVKLDDVNGTCGKGVATSVCVQKISERLKYLHDQLDVDEVKI
jgi:hypothetical protein